MARSSACYLLLVSVRVTMLLAIFVSFSEYCSKVEPLFVPTPVRFSNYLPRESTISYVSAVAWSAVPKFTAFLDALDVSDVEAMLSNGFPCSPRISASRLFCNVDLLVGGFREVPLAGGGGELVPLLRFFCLIVQHQHCAVGNVYKDVVADGKGGAFRLSLCLLQHVNILRDTFSRVV